MEEKNKNISGSSRPAFIKGYKLLRNFKVVEELDRETGNYKIQDVSDKRKNRESLGFRESLVRPGSCGGKKSAKLDCPG